jgi:hypothetical protein
LPLSHLISQFPLPEKYLFLILTEKKNGLPLTRKFAEVGDAFSHDKRRAYQKILDCHIFAFDGNLVVLVSYVVRRVTEPFLLSFLVDKFGKKREKKKFSYKSFSRPK